ncbi:hypothetical protein Cgig2_018824 [Carnegiea gigantea]|uniref:TACO1/YebC-like second and third domain-containing protein n=1 Tax=Carnegiea gigantea TaxID=171969 RepID=A0A9Q1KIE2_9CARY|nr:hypothetical protein Cgig2_018824 [Carnegiea gigantea]
MSTCSSSCFRTLGTILHRVSSGGAPLLQCPFSSLHCKTLSLSLSLSLMGIVWTLVSHTANVIPSYEMICGVCLCGHHAAVAPLLLALLLVTLSVAMETLQGAQDLKKAKLYSKIGKQVVSAVKKGGPNPISNTALATVLEKAKELDVYGYGGVGFVVEVLTDKVNRSVAAVRSVVKDCGGKMADSGSVMFRFRRARTVSVKVGDADKDQLLEVALDAGAEDVIEPSDEEDNSEEYQSERYYKIVSSPENYPAILSKLRDEGISFEPDSGFELIPINLVEV